MNIPCHYRMEKRPMCEKLEKWERWDNREKVEKFYFVDWDIEIYLNWTSLNKVINFLVHGYVYECKFMPASGF